MTTVGTYQADLLAQLAAIVAEIKRHYAAILELEHQKKRVEYLLRNCGWKAGEP
jgi:hypothetical protein